MQEKTYVHFLFSRGELVVDWDKRTLEFSLRSLLYWRGWKLIIPFNNLITVNAKSLNNVFLPSRSAELIKDRRLTYEFSSYWMELKYNDEGEEKSINFSPGGKYFRNASLVDEWVEKLQPAVKDHTGPAGVVEDGFRNQAKILRKIFHIIILILVLVTVLLMIVTIGGPFFVVMFEKLLSLG